MRKGKNNDWEKQLPSLCKAFLTLKTPQECKNFLRDLCTITEMRAIVERWQAARMIDKGIPYREIAKQTGISTATITRVGKWLKGEKKGYKTALKRLRDF